MRGDVSSRGESGRDSSHIVQSQGASAEPMSVHFLAGRVNYCSFREIIQCTSFFSFADRRRKSRLFNGIRPEVYD